MIYKEVIGKELYVYMNGSLLYKRWLDYNYGMIFCNIWGWRPFNSKSKDNDRQCSGSSKTRLT
jgi:hypothetical protein